MSNRVLCLLLEEKKGPLGLSSSTYLDVESDLTTFRNAQECQWLANVADNRCICV